MQTPTTTHLSSVQVASAISEIALVNGAPARRVKLLPIGTFTLRDGRGPFRVRDSAHANQVVAATRAWLGTADFNWDYNHQVLATGAGGRSGSGRGGLVQAGYAARRKRRNIHRRRLDAARHRTPSRPRISLRQSAIHGAARAGRRRRDSSQERRPGQHRRDRPARNRCQRVNGRGSPSRRVRIRDRRRA